MIQVLWKLLSGPSTILIGWTKSPLVRPRKKSVLQCIRVCDFDTSTIAPKASAIHVKVGFPLSPNTSNAQAIARYYSQVKVNKTDFFGNMLNAGTFTQSLKWAKLGKQRDREAWEVCLGHCDALFLTSRPFSDDPITSQCVFQPSGQ